MFNFNKVYNHHEIRGHLYSNKKIALHYIADCIIGINPYHTKQKPQHHHNSTSNKRKLARKKHRRRNMAEINNQGRRRTVVAFGNGNVNSSMRGHPSLSQKAIYQIIS